MYRSNGAVFLATFTMTVGGAILPPMSRAALAQDVDARESADAEMNEAVPTEAGTTSEQEDTRSWSGQEGELPLSDLVTLSLEGLLAIKVTSASKQEEMASEAPSSITVYTQRDIARLGFTTVRELLNLVPGYQAYKDRAGIRRISVRGRLDPTSVTVLILVDGQRLNDLYSGGTSFLSHGIALENIEQIEVIRGPGSALYGANAFLGVINIKTNRDRTDLTAAAGNLNSRLLALNAAESFGELKVAAFAKYYSDTGWNYPKVPDILGQTGFTNDPLQALDGHINVEYGAATLNLRHTNYLHEGYYNLGPPSKYSNETRSDVTSARIAVSTEITEGVAIDVAAVLRQYRTTALSTIVPAGIVLDPSSGFSLTSTLILGRDVATLAGSGSVDVRWRAFSVDWANGTLLAGASAEYAKMTRIATLSSHDPITLRYQGDIREFTGSKAFNSGDDRSIVAGYVQAKANLWSCLALTAGVRYDWYSDFDGTLNPRAALVYTTPWDSHLKLMYGRAFRAPNFLELYDQNNPLVVGSPDVKPEIVNTLEAAYTQPILDFAYATLTYFHSSFSDQITPDVQAVPVAVYGNIGHSTSQGLELELRTRDVHGFSALGSYTHVFFDKDVDTTQREAGDFGAVVLGYARGPFTVSVNGILRAAISDVDGQEFVPAYWLLGGQIQFDVTPAVHLLARGLNLNGANPRSYNPDFSGGVRRRGRTFLFGVRVEL